MCTTPTNANFIFKELQPKLWVTLERLTGFKNSLKWWPRYFNAHPSWRWEERHFLLWDGWWEWVELLTTPPPSSRAGSCPPLLVYTRKETSVAYFETHAHSESHTHLSTITVNRSHTELNSGGVMWLLLLRKWGCLGESSVSARVAKFRELSKHFLVFQKSWI